MLSPTTFPYYPCNCLLLSLNPLAQPLIVKNYVYPIEKTLFELRLSTSERILLSLLTHTSGMLVDSLIVSELSDTTEVHGILDITKSIFNSFIFFHILYLFLTQENVLNFYLNSNLRHIIKKMAKHVHSQLLIVEKMQIIIIAAITTHPSDC